MPSKLVNLKHTLEWREFPKKTVPPPAPGKTAVAAHTDASYSKFAWGFDSVPGGFRLKDNIVITITFNKPQSWVAEWVFRDTPKFQKDLLNHEQGHYNIVALMARDLFVDLMLTKSTVFTNGTLARQAITKLTTQYSSQTIKAINTKYDAKSETNHGLNKTTQDRWDGYFKKAFTEARRPASASPDGKAHKVTLLDVLKSAGKFP